MALISPKVSLFTNNNGVASVSEKIERFCHVALPLSKVKIAPLVGLLVALNVLSKIKPLSLLTVRELVNLSNETSPINSGKSWPPTLTNVVPSYLCKELSVELT